MFTKTRIHFALAAVLVLIVALAVPSFARAGGWVVITLDQLPESVIAGQPYSIGMMARQHGRTPWQMDKLRIEAKHPETGQTVTFIAKPNQQPGHYQAELLFPEPGRWEWGIASGLYPQFQPMPTLEVAEFSQSAGIAADPSIGHAAGVPDVPAPLLGFFALLTLTTFAAGMVMIVRGRNKRFPFLAGVGLMILCAGLAFAFFSSANAQAKQVAAVPVTAAGETTGQKLFLAKGCVVCHTHERAINGSEEYGVNVGPNLTAYSNDPTFLHQLLKDPQSVKATSEMPDLELKLVEIEALVEFINSDKEK